jgi:integrase/recombinase XerD
MTLRTRLGARKYLNAAERQHFATAASTLPDKERLFVLLLMWSGCRISEALAVSALAIDCDSCTVALITLKRRQASVIREVPLPREYVNELARVFDLRVRQSNSNLATARLWRWSRATGWRLVKEIMRRANITGAAAMPKGLRHSFGVAAYSAVPPHLVQRWMGHASARTTAIYGDVSGAEERLFAQRIWDTW